MEKFMLIFHGDDYSTLSPDEIQMRMGKWYEWIEKLSKTEQYISGEPLEPGGKDVKGNSGELVTEGPYTEGAEIVGGFFVIKAKDYDEAVAISKDFPDFDLGSYVQVRKVMNMEE